MTLYAKSDGTTLQEHTSHVVSAMHAIAYHLMPELSVTEFEKAKRGAILHDLGKAHPIFQAMLDPKFNQDRYRYDVPHRHEISSLLFLPLFTQTDWPDLIDMVVAHHKSLIAPINQKGRGLIDLVDQYGDDAVFERHAEEWENWHTKVFCFLPVFDIPCRELTRTEIRDAFDRVLQHCEQERLGRNRLRGLLMSADHLASALQDETESRVYRLFLPPDLTAFHRRAAEASEDLFPLAKKPVDSQRRHTLVIAPTGAGKTDYLLRRCHQGRIFYLLPFQASINAMYLRLDRTLNVIGEVRVPVECLTDIRRVHASAQIEIDGEIQEETLLQRHPGAAIKVMTPHQIAALAFGLAGHEAVALDVAGQNVILDEIHVYSEQAQAMVLALVQSLVKLGCTLHIGSATIPSALAAAIRAALGGATAIHEVRLTEAELVSYDRHAVYRLRGENEARDYINAHLAQNERVLFISNRVATSQERFRWIQQTFPGVPALLLHSRFRRGDRALLERQIEVFDQTAGRCIVCSTQVIEVSLDISFDTLVTDCAPLDSLIQRLGRVNRRRRPAAEAMICPVGVISPPATNAEAKPYELDVLQRSWDVLPDGGVLHEISLQQLIDLVYPNLDLTQIDVHLVENDQGFRLRELCHYPRSLLLEALEIDSACVIRKSDESAYRAGRSDDRQKLEIPIPINALRGKFKEWPQIEPGNRPFVCPDYFYDQELGLSLTAVGAPSCIIL